MNDNEFTWYFGFSLHSPSNIAAPNATVVVIDATRIASNILKKYIL